MNDLIIDTIHPALALPYGNIGKAPEPPNQGGARGKFRLGLGASLEAVVGVILHSFRITPLIYTKAKKNGYFSFW